MKTLYCFNYSATKHVNTNFTGLAWGSGFCEAEALANAISKLSSSYRNIAVLGICGVPLPPAPQPRKHA